RPRPRRGSNPATEIEPHNSRSRRDPDRLAHSLGEFVVSTNRDQRQSSGRTIAATIGSRFQRTNEVHVTLSRQGASQRRSRVEGSPGEAAKERTGKRVPRVGAIVDAAANAAERFARGLFATLRETP